MSLFTTFPGKYLWATSAALVTLVKLPILPFYYAPGFTKPVPHWTIFQALMSNLMNAFLYHSAVVESKTPLSLEPGSLGDRFTVVQPGPASLYQDLTDIDPAIQPVKVGGTWYPKKYSPSPSSNDVVALHFHGGGYAIATGRPEDSAYAGKQLERLCGGGFMVQYRLATNENGRFPAQLQDAISAYNYFLNELKIPARNIVISGDSVGGHIVICLLRYLAEHGTGAGLPNPRAAFIWSGAVDLVAGSKPESIRANPNYGVDYSDAGFMSWGAKRFLSNHAKAAPYMNFLGNAFATKVPIWAYVGEKEFFHQELTQFIGEMKQVPGNDAHITVEKNAPHDIFFTANIMGWAQQAEAAVDKAREWLKLLEV